jgi:hypothetical protein
MDPCSLDHISSCTSTFGGLLPLPPNTPQAPRCAERAPGSAPIPPALGQTDGSAPLAFPSLDVVKDLGSRPPFGKQPPPL